jgi:biopolymer transport protein ExbD
MAGTSDKPEDPITAINVTPLVDVSLVLVIILMAVAPMAVTVGIKILQSKPGAAKGKVSAEDNVQVRLTTDEKLTVNGHVTDKAGLRDEISKSLEKSRDKMVILTADDANRVGEVVSILDTAKQAGALKLAMVKMLKAAK